MHAQRCLFLLAVSVLTNAGFLAAGDSPADTTVSWVKDLGGTARVDEKQPGRPVVQIDLGNADATDAAVAKLATLSELEILSLRRTAVTDAGLAAIRGLRKLRELDLGKTKVGDAGLAAL